MEHTVIVSGFVFGCVDAKDDNSMDESEAWLKYINVEIKQGTLVVRVGMTSEISSKMCGRIRKNSIPGITTRIGEGIAVLLVVLLFNMLRSEVVVPSNEDEKE